MQCCNAAPTQCCVLIHATLLQCNTPMRYQRDTVAMQHCKAAPLGQALKNAAALLGIDSTMQCCNAAHQRDAVVMRQSDAENDTAMHATL